MAPIRNILLALLAVCSAAHAGTAPPPGRAEDLDPPPISLVEWLIPCLGDEDPEEKKQETPAETPPAGEEGGVKIGRLLATGAVGACVLAGYLVYGFTKWWEDVRVPFHYTREGNLERDSYVGGMDKFGHAWGCHALQRGATALLLWSGFPRGWAVLASAVLVQAVFTFAEFEDAVYDYGWSDWDIIFNLLGSALAASLDLVPWLDDLIDFRLWYLPTPYFYRRNYNAAEDFSGQKYFLVLKGGGVPWFRDTGFEYLELYVGFHAPGYRRYREVRERRVFFGFSLDVGRVLARFLFPAIRAPRVVESGSAFVFEHWQPHALHAPLADAKLP